ncbi:hypothetical protein BN1080_02403 [Planococcus massiliensis]|uniref:Uncharacterized protein n=1 Tax=Planococcus massiliensis TaxID=1499687 RepID=A0A098ENR8_9BACL|nr:hypothetical protein [Planococcus massiliensis]CEG23427.1 hypothetical protein BN1080_02403 [Planococcus massiliensis]
MKDINNHWQFSRIPNIEESNFNKILERFYSLGVAGLTRENIQNSLDGRLKEADQPVVVKIELGTVKRQSIPGIESIVQRINSLEGRNGYTKETISHMKASMLEDKVRYISFEDSNTKGLSGAKYGQTNSKDHTWGIYAYNKGVHFEEKDENFEASRGGSHGVGKIASNAASDIHMMYFANCDAEGEQHLGGTIQLIEHKLGNNYYRSTGYFAKLIDEKFMPFENHFHQIFEKKTRGLKIVIPFLRENFYKKDEIIRAICDSFFVSIIEEKLIVHVNDLIIDSKTIDAIVSDPQYYTQEIEMMKKVFTPLYVNTYKNMQPRTIEVGNQTKIYKFNLYFNYDERIPKGRMAIIRTIGMKIEDFAVKNNSTKPFNAVLIGGIEEDSYLKSLENESHTKISSDDIKDPHLVKQARKFIGNLNKEVVKVIEEEIRKSNPVDGKINTGDLLYTMELDFKDNLSQAFAATKIKNGKSLVTNETGENTDATQAKIKRKKREKTAKVDSTDTGVRKKGKMREKGVNENAAEDQKDEYKINPARVERLLMQNQEVIQLNLASNPEVAKAQSCQIKFNIIDGMGKEYLNEFNMLENYSTVIDTNSGNDCEISPDSIKNVSIKDGIVSLQLALKPAFNRSLKFMYYVEV